jgi:hypothetical protein
LGAKVGASQLDEEKSKCANLAWENGFAAADLLSLVC